ncbi:MAG TPA: ribonuclease HII [Bacteroidota bacterium]|jgi:ribonuclease HII|nr:ribonuclease HII [Bacteroidota bacterium]
MADFRFERGIWDRGIRHIAGVDEAGRGPLAGPVVAAAVILSDSSEIHGVDDSKKLSSQRREELFQIITGQAISIGVGIVPHTVIDEINIYQATMRAMAEAIAKLSCAPEYLFIDGPRYQRSSIPFTAIVDGDAKSYSIAAASIVAKVTRDRLMREFDVLYPQYGFARHKGYGTSHHFDALRRYGPCEIHRKSFRMPGLGGTILE